MQAVCRPIYLDYNATTPHDPEVVEAMRPFLESISVTRPAVTYTASLLAAPW